MGCRLTLAAALALGSLTACPGPCNGSDPVKHVARWRHPGACGANCLYGLLQCQNVRVTYDAVADLMSVDPTKGTSLEQLKESAAVFGLEAETRRLDPGSFRYLSPPYIVDREDPDHGTAGHYVLVFLHDKNGCHFLDGTTGLENAASWDDFAPACTGYVLIPRGFFRNFPWATLAWLGVLFISLVYAGLCWRAIR